MLSGLKVGDLEAADGRAFTDCIGHTTQTNSGHQQLQRLGLTDSADDACAGVGASGGRLPSHIGAASRRSPRAEAFPCRCQSCLSPYSSPAAQPDAGSCPHCPIAPCLVDQRMPVSMPEMGSVLFIFLVCTAFRTVWKHIL